MSAATWDIKVLAGTDWVRTLEFTDEGTGLAKDLTGYTVKMQVRKSADDTTVIQELSTDPDKGVTIDGPNGLVILTLTDTQTTALRGRSGVYDLKLTSPDGTDSRPLQGKFSVDVEVTK